MLKAASTSLTGSASSCTLSTGSLPPPTACSRDAKKIFEAALSESRRMSMSFITPEHILLALLAVGDTTSRALFEG